MVDTKQWIQQELKAGIKLFKNWHYAMTAHLQNETKNKSKKSCYPIKR